MLLLIVGGIIGLSIFLYFKKYMENRREEKRELYRERREEQLNQLLQLKKDPTKEQEMRGDTINNESGDSLRWYIYENRF